MGTKTIIQLAVAAVVFAFAFIAKSNAKRKSQETGKKNKKGTLYFFLMIVSAWYIVGLIVTEISGKHGGLHVEFEMFSPRTEIFGFSIAETTLLSYIVTAVVAVLAIIFRLFVFPRFKKEPKGLQNLLEAAVEAMDSFTKGVVGHLYHQLSPYMFAIAVFMIGCAATELFGQRPPTSDLLITGTMGLMTFFLINFYGIKEKGFGGRIKSMATPSPIIFPMKILSDVAVPVSLACRLFGNMIGGMIVMELLKSALGGYSVGVTALAGIYFNLFHPLIQTYIFVILSLTFINEAVE